MNVTQAAVAALLEQGVSPEIRNDPALLSLTRRLALEVVDYGHGVMDDLLFSRSSGREIAAMACEDVETALLLVELAGSAPEARLVFLEHGVGLGVISTAVRMPERAIHTVVATERGRWLLRRLVALLRLRNVVVHAGQTEAFHDAAPDGWDLVCIKGLGPRAAIDVGLPLTGPGGRILSWQRSDRSAEIRERRLGPRGEPTRLERKIASRCPAARGRTLLCIACETPQASPAVAAG